MKIKRVMIFAVLLAMILSNINLTAASDSDRPDFEIEHTGTRSAWAGDIFSVGITIRNNRETSMENINVYAAVSDNSIARYAGARDITRTIEGESSSTFSFDFEALRAGSVQISFEVSRDDRVIAERAVTVTVQAIYNPYTPSGPQEWDRFEIITELYSPSSRQVSAGGSIRMGFRIGNIGAESRNVTASVHFGSVGGSFDGSGFRPTTQTVHSLGSMNSGESVYIDFNFSVTNEAKDGLNMIWLVIEADGGRERRHPISVTVDNTGVVIDSNMPNLIFTDIKLPENVKRGERFTLSAVIENTGADAHDILIKLTPPTGIESTSRDMVQISSLLQHESREIFFELIVREDAPNNNWNRLTLTADAKNQKGEDAPQTVQYTGLNVLHAGAAENLSVRVSSAVPSRVRPNQEFKLIFTVTNNGSDNENNLRINVSRPAGMANVTQTGFIIPELKAGESVTSEITFVARASAAGDSAVFEITVGDTDQPLQSVVIFVENPDESLQDFIISISSAPLQVSRNQDFKLVFSVANNGSSDERNFRINVSVPAGVVSKSASSFVIPELNAGESVTREVTFMALTEAAGKSIVFDIIVFDMTQSVVVFVENISENDDELYMDIAIQNISIPANVNTGDTFLLEITAANTGETELKNVNLSVTSPPGMIIRGSEQETIRSMRPGETYTLKVEYTAPDTGSGYQAFKAELTADGDIVTRHFGTMLNSSDLRIENIRVPSSVGVDYDFNLEIVILNTGADASNIRLSLAPQAGLISKSQNPAIIGRIGAGETVTRSFTFRALASAPDAFVPINITITNGEETIEQVSGVTVINPPKDPDEDKPNEKLDMPVVIISRFSYENIIDNQENQVDGFDTGFGGDDFARGFYESGEDLFMPNSIMVEAPAPARVMPGGNIGGGNIGGGAGPVRPAGQVRDSHAVFGGSSFMFNLELLNTHREVAVRDLKITISSAPTTNPNQSGGVFNPKAGSNTFFIELLNPGETIERSIELLVRSDAVPDSYGLLVSMSYRNEDSDSPTTTVSEIINIPVQQEMRFSIGELPPINEVQLGDEAYVSLNFGNLGRSLIYNVIVRIAGDGFFNMEGGTIYAGDIDPGKFVSREIYLMTTMPGFIEGSFVFSYEDVDRNVYEEVQPFFFFVSGGDDMIPGMWDDRPMFPDGGEFLIDPETGEIVIDPKTGLPVMVYPGDFEDGGESWLAGLWNSYRWFIIGGGVLLLIIIIIIIVAVRKKKARELDDDDDEQNIVQAESGDE